MDAFLRVRGTPIIVQQLARECPLPIGVPGKFLKVLSSDERFELQELGSSSPMVQMRQTPPMAEVAATSVTTDREKWLSRCFHFSELQSMHIMS